MNVISTVVFATALVAVCDVSMAAEPAVIKSIQPNAQPAQVIATTSDASIAGSIAADGVAQLRHQGNEALQQIQHDARNHDWSQAFELPPLLLAEPLPVVANVSEAGRQLASK